MAAGRPRQSQMQRRDAAHAWRMRVELHRVFSHDQSRAALQGAGSSPRPMVNSQDVRRNYGRVASVCSGAIILKRATLSAAYTPLIQYLIFSTSLPGRLASERFPVAAPSEPALLVFFFGLSWLHATARPRSP